MITVLDLLKDIDEMRSLAYTLFNGRQYMRTSDYPYINLYEKDDNIDIAVLAPGVRAEDIDLELINNNLNISYAKKNDYEDRKYIKKERSFGSFRKVVELPYIVDTNKIDATMKEGILVIRLTRAEQAKPVQIEIH